MPPDDNRKYVLIQSKNLKLKDTFKLLQKLLTIFIFIDRFDVMFSNQNVTLSFKLSDGLSEAHAALLSPLLKITRKSDRMEIVI